MTRVTFDQILIFVSWPQKERRAGAKTSLSLSLSLSLSYSYILELVHESQVARVNCTVMPLALFEKIKVRPPPPRKFTTHSHIIDEQWMRLEASKVNNVLSHSKELLAIREH